MEPYLSVRIALTIPQTLPTQHGLDAVRIGRRRRIHRTTEAAFFVSRRTTRANFENHFADFEVQEILREPYTGRPFPGYEDIDLSFDELETLVRNNRPDWKAALENAKGIYLITDTKPPAAMSARRTGTRNMVKVAILC